MATGRAVDVVRPVCPHASNHRHYRRLFNMFPSKVHGRVATLVVRTKHICESRMITDTVPDWPPPLPGTIVYPYMTMSDSEFVAP